MKNGFILQRRLGDTIFFLKRRNLIGRGKTKISSLR
jgi:hypothetical protein